MSPIDTAAIAPNDISLLRNIFIASPIDSALKLEFDEMLSILLQQKITPRDKEGSACWTPACTNPTFVLVKKDGIRPALIFTDQALCKNLSSNEKICR